MSQATVVLQNVVGWDKLRSSLAKAFYNNFAGNRQNVRQVLIAYLMQLRPVVLGNDKLRKLSKRRLTTPFRGGTICPSERGLMSKKA
jgi:hypothetical protein